MPHRFGYVLPEKRSYGVAKEHDRVMQNMPLMTACGRPIIGTGAGKVVLLYKYYSLVPGAVYSGVIQKIGSCVAFGWVKGIETEQVVSIALKGETEEWRHSLATEWLYGTSRVLVGKGRLGNSDGSIGSWMAKAVQEHGTLHRIKYGSIDLTTYSGKREKDWGYRGLPVKLEEIADEHPVEQVGLTTSYEMARDAIANGYPVPVCSRQGFSSTRDREGFAKPDGVWPHCMCFVAVDDSHKRPGLLCDNRSWGPNWNSGPKRHDQPDGTFWVDAHICDKMLRQEDSFAVAGYQGFKARDLTWEAW